MNRLAAAAAVAMTVAGSTTWAHAQTCSPAYTLGCDATDSWGNDRTGSTSVVASYGCPGSPSASGSEYAYSFVAPGSGEVTVTLSGLAADLDLYVLAEGGSGCDPADCVGRSTTVDDADEQVTFTATAGSTYYLVVDGYAGATSDFDIALECGFEVPCSPAWELGCGESDSWDTTRVGHTDMVGGYSCSPWDESGNEYVYAFTAPADGTATVTLTDLGSDLDLFVMAAPDGACDPGGCIAYGETTATFRATAGRLYYIAVDGYFGAEGPFTIDLGCELDSRCSPDHRLTCGLPHAGNNAFPGSTDEVNRYSCSAECGGWDEAGPEYAYTFVAPVGGSYSATLSGLDTGEDLDVYVLAGAGGVCAPSSCAACGNTTATWTATAGSTYYVVVDGYGGDISDYDVVVNCPALDVCLPATGVGCGGTLRASTLDPEATDNVDRYACSTWTESGPEMAYTFEPRVTADVTARVGSLSPAEDLDVFVLEDRGIPCEPDHCIAHGDLSASFHAVEGRTYHVVVDGYFGDAGDFSLGIECAFGCAPRLDLGCGSLEAGDTRGAGTTERIADYSCAGWSETGPEYAYRFVAAGDGVVTVEIDGMTGDLDVFVMRDSAGECDPSTCLAFGDSAATFDAVAGQTYYIVVDGFLGAEDEYLISVECEAPACDRDRDGFDAALGACGGDDCDDTRAGINPRAAEVCGDGIDQDCSGADQVCPDCTDADSDGSGVGSTCIGARDCDDTSAAIHPGATEVCGDRVDQDCDGADLPCPCADRDGDGYQAGSGCTGALDCDDTSGAVHPGATEVCGDGIDQDCSGADLTCPTCADRDGDGYGVGAGCIGPDCDDFAAAINPGATEQCGNGIDEDCSGGDRPCATDCADGDGDGYGAGTDCLGPDCNDRDPDINPEARDDCGDGVDQDCSGADAPCPCDDDDDDGHDDAACGGDDCDDSDEAVHPGAAELCGNGIDEDCDGDDPECPCEDGDGDGYGARLCGGDDCDDTDDAINPGAADESCDGVDQDCTGLDNCPCVDGDGDGFGVGDSCTGRADCDDRNPTIHPGGDDLCGNGVDEDCSGADRPCMCAADADGDGFVSIACAGGDDCDDSDPEVRPGATERCGNDVDDDCDGAVDETGCLSEAISSSACNCRSAAAPAEAPLLLALTLLALLPLRRGPGRARR